MTWSKPSTSSSRGADARSAAGLGLLAAGAACIALLVLAFLLAESWPVLADGGWRRLYRDGGWYPDEGLFGLVPMLAATLVAAAGAVLIATPLGVASAVAMHFYTPRMLGRLQRALLALLAGVPSVVFGLWGLTVVVPLIAAQRPPGTSLLAAMLILALMVLPTIALTSASALAAVSPGWLRGAAALGFGRRATILGVALPAARAGIRAGVLLAVARALGETMAVLMVAGNVARWPQGLFDPVRVLTANIALEMSYATGAHRAGLYASGLVLTLLVLVLAVLGARTGRGPEHA